ncbi:hypothetical protein K435DRAFT_811484 [Dendrothele bispora CBS 962.96]|uniref:Uncharacterized protein n=1 Tax=Dendrothele bispora (strain CBS 962.96) TaxID=1314807 RepID=A0A4S8KRW6_DENBC|nr:hypothetical protein K435DRAFT_811484 [Dendrothele bispora CBS 962.96]
MTEQNIKTNKLKHKIEEEEGCLPDTKRHRQASTVAGSKISEIIGPGGYFDSQTTDTQYFELSQSGSSNEFEQVESQTHGGIDSNSHTPEPRFQGDRELDYKLEVQSQLPEDFTIPDDESLPATDTYCSPQPSPSIKFQKPEVPKALDVEWIASTVNQKKLDHLLNQNYGHSTFLYDLVAEQEDPSTMRKRWEILREENCESDKDPARLALLRLTHAAGVSNSNQRFGDLNPVQQGHVMVARLLVWIAYALICHVRQPTMLE